MKSKLYKPGEQMHLQGEEQSHSCRVLPEAAR